MKRFIGVSLLIFCIGLLLSSGKLISHQMFSFHDQTQAARIADFTFALQNGQIPPRLAHHFSYEMGYPIFNYYAPTAYWITSALHVLGFSIPNALKISFLLASMVLAIGTYSLLRMYFAEKAALVGAFLLVSSPLIALEIYVRGNLAELWFLALFPVVLTLIKKLSIRFTRTLFFSLALIFSLLLTSHNALSIVGAMLVGIFAWMHQKRIQICASLLLGLLCASYFLIPAFAELNLTHATGIAASTYYQDHFVCIRQLWTSQWGYGGSVPGCVDGMSFMLGKILLVTAFIGGLHWLWSLIKTKKDSRTYHSIVIFFGLIGTMGIFLSLSYSSFVWIIFEPLLKLFQFPWRFLGLTLFGCAFLSAYCVESVFPKKIGPILVSVIIVLALLMNKHYFVPNPQKIWSENEFEEKFISEEYIHDEVSARVPEYYPKSVDYKSILTQEAPVMDLIITPLDGGSVHQTKHSLFSYDVQTTSQSFYVNKHYLPHWLIELNGKPYIPHDFDSFGRPKITIIDSPSISNVTLRYSQTYLEKLANLMSLSSIIILVLCMHPKIWKRLSH